MYEVRYEDEDTNPQEYVHIFVGFHSEGSTVRRVDEEDIGDTAGDQSQDGLRDSGDDGTDQPGE